jgi:peptidoglycan/LPS O-acetylase OafA/YrhL
MRPNADSPERGWLFCLMVGCAIPVVADLPHSMLTRVAHIVCRYSYGIYLLHLPAIWFSFTVLGHSGVVTQWAVFIALIFALPVAAYHLIENPGIRLGKRVVRATLRPLPSRTLIYP